MIPEEASTKSLLSKKDYEEIRTIVRQSSQKGALSSQKSESMISVRAESKLQQPETMIPNDSKSLASQISETTYRS